MNERCVTSCLWLSAIFVLSGTVEVASEQTDAVQLPASSQQALDECTDMPIDYGQLNSPAAVDETNKRGVNHQASSVHNRRSLDSLYNAVTGSAQDVQSRVDNSATPRTGGTIKSPKSVCIIGVSPSSALGEHTLDNGQLNSMTTPATVDHMNERSMNCQTSSVHNGRSLLYSRETGSTPNVQSRVDKRATPRTGGTRTTTPISVGISGVSPQSCGEGIGLDEMYENWHLPCNPTGVTASAALVGMNGRNLNCQPSSMQATGSDFDYADVD